MADHDTSEGWDLFRTIILVLAIAVGLASFIFIPYIPIGLSIWFMLLMFLNIIPKPDKFIEQDSVLYKLAYLAHINNIQENPKSKRSYKKLIWRIFSFRIWRLSESNSSILQEEELGRRDRTIFKPCTVGSVRAICAGLILAGTDLMLTAYLRSVYIPSIESEDPILMAFDQWANPNYRLPYIGVLSFFFGFAFAKIYSEDKRWKQHEETRDEVLVSAIIMSPIMATAKSGIKAPVPLGWKRLFSVTSIIIMLPFFAIGVALTFNPFFLSYGWMAGSVMLGLGLGVLISSSFKLPFLNSQIDGWDIRHEMATNWFNRWESVLPKNKPPPDFMQCLLEMPEENPQIKSIAFSIPSGQSVQTYQKLVGPLKAALGCTHLSIEPFAMIEEPSEGGPDVVGIQAPPEPQYLPDAFVLSYIEGEAQNIGSKIFTEDYMSIGTLDLMTTTVKLLIAEAFLDLKLPVPLYRGGNLITSQSSESPLYKTYWDLPGGITRYDVSDKGDEFISFLKCDYFGVGQEGRMTQTTIVLGGDSYNASFDPDKREANIKLLRELDWGQYMREAKLVGSGNTVPRLRKVIAGNLGVEKFYFDLPGGISVSNIRNATDKLRSSSSYEYIDAQQLEESPNTCVIFAARKDPLNQIYSFDEYADSIISPPKKKNERMDYCVGMGGDGKLLTQLWGEGDAPHILIAGTSGQGKSEMVNSLLCQLCHNNDPEDVHLWLIEPKTELQAYRYLEHTKYFISQDMFESGDFLIHSTTILEEAYKELRKRNVLLGQADLQNIKTARDLAKKDPEKYGHLLIPYIIVVVEECSTFFRKLGAGHTPEETDAHKKFSRLAQEMAEQARAYGMYFVFVTQYPTAENIHRSVKTNCRGIGLKTADATASRVIIDDDGLQDITTRGRGIAVTKDGRIGFRGFLLTTEEERDGEIVEVDRRREIVERLPVSTTWPKLPKGVPTENLLQVRKEDLEERQKTAKENYNAWYETYQARHDKEDIEV